MRSSILIIDKAIEPSRMEESEWLKQGGTTVHAATMQEGIEKVINNPHLFAVINADSINYLPLLKVMRDLTSTLIFVATSNYNLDEQAMALYAGADYYTMILDDAKQNVKLASAIIHRSYERNKKPPKTANIIIYENIIVVPDTRRIYCNDERLLLTKKEYEILFYLITNHDCVLSYGQIYSAVWKQEHDKAATHTLRNFIFQIRNKLKEKHAQHEYIHNERDYGYRFSLKPDE